MLFQQLLLALLSSVVIVGEDEKGSKENHSSSSDELKSSWSLWYDLQPKRGLQLEDYRKLLQKVGTFASISGFWDTWHKLFDHIPDQVCNFQVFKEGIEPIWEDERNIRGGKWIITRGSTSRVEDNIKDWLSLVLSMIAGGLGFEDDICGAVLSIRNWGISITIWNSDSSNIDEINQISEKLKMLLSTDQIRYQPHQASLKRNVVQRHASFPTNPRSTSHSHHNNEYNNNNNNNHSNRQHSRGKKQVERALSAPAVLASTGKNPKQSQPAIPKQESEKSKKRRQNQRQRQKQKQQQQQQPQQQPSIISADSQQRNPENTSTTLSTSTSTSKLDILPVPSPSIASTTVENKDSSARKRSKKRSPRKPNVSNRGEQEPRNGNGQGDGDPSMSKKLVDLVKPLTRVELGISLLIGATLTAIYIL